MCYVYSPSPPAGSDYNALMNFVFIMTQGQTSATIPVPIINDDAFELTESFSAALSLISPITPRITVAPNEAGITIEDDDSEFHGGVVSWQE